MLLYNNKAGYICCCLLLFVKNLTNWHEGVLLFFSGRFRGHPDGVLIHVRQRQHVSRIQHNAAVLPQAFSRLNFFFYQSRRSLLSAFTFHADPQIYLQSCLQLQHGEKKQAAAEEPACRQRRQGQRKIHSSAAATLANVG